MRVSLLQNTVTKQACDDGNISCFRLIRLDEGSVGFRWQNHINQTSEPHGYASSELHWKGWSVWALRFEDSRGKT